MIKARIIATGATGKTGSVVVAEAALAPEIARQPLEVRKRINQSMLAYRERLLPYVSGRTAEEKRARAFILASGMAGVLVAARAIADPQGRERMLAAAIRRLSSDSSFRSTDAVIAKGWHF
jgi:hypothetical protein